MTLQHTIEAAFERRADITPANAEPALLAAINEVLDALQRGELRVAEPLPAGGWQVNEWLKKAVLLSFRVYDNVPVDHGYTRYFDKVESRFAHHDAARFQTEGVRVVPPAVARRGSYLGKGVVLMPSYVNIGAYVDEGTMVDTWVTVGSCAQIGKNVHLIGARSEIVEGVVVEKGSVISMGVFIGQSTKIYNRMTGEISYGRVPAGSVVVPGSLPAADGSHSLACAVIIKQVDEKTRSKTGINDLLRP